MHCKICGDWTCELLEDVHSLVAYANEEDMDGNFHYHDRNERWQEWKCSKGHTFKCAAYNQFWCGWTSQYPELSNTRQFKERKPIKGVKFGQKIEILNKKHINMCFLAIKNAGEKKQDV